MSLMSRITVDPNQCGGQPCIRGMPIRVVDVLDLLAQDLSMEEVTEELPDLEYDDVLAALHYAARQLDPAVRDAS